LDESCCLGATFANKGKSAINKEIKGEVWVDGKFFLYLITPCSLLPGQSSNWKGGAPFRLIGSHTVKMILDSNNQLAETDESNNIMTQTFNCLTGHDIAITDVSSTGPSGKPANAPVIVLENKGTKSIAGNLSLTIKTNGQLICGCSAAVNLAPGQKTEWKGGAVMENFAKPGDTVEATIDTDNKLIEDNEQNNTMIKKIATGYRKFPSWPSKSKFQGG
jgi:hypothetical protein